MGAQTVDYRVSRLVVLCKDCGNDVGLYPARHKCQPVDRPAMPALPAQYSSTINVDRSASSSNPSTRVSNNTNKTTHEVDEEDSSVYLNNFTANLPEHQQQESNGKKLWGKIRQNEKWKQLTEKNDKSKQTGKLWGKLIQATQNMADKIPSRDDRGPDSDEDDWEGETHVSRILREYYERKQQPLPHWLMDDDIASALRKQSGRLSADQGEQRHLNLPTNGKNDIGRSPSRRRLWEHDTGDNNVPENLSSRERERQELRQQALTKSQPLSQRRHISSDYSEPDEYARSSRSASSSGNRRNYGRYADNSEETSSYHHDVRSDNHHRNNSRYNSDRRNQYYNETPRDTGSSRSYLDREDAFAADNRRLPQHRSKSTSDNSSRSRHHDEPQQQQPPIRSAKSVKGYNSNGPLLRSDYGDTDKSLYSSSASTSYQRSNNMRGPSFGDTNRTRRYAPPEPGYF